MRTINNIGVSFAAQFMLKKFIEQLSKNFDLQHPLAPNEDGSYSLRLEPNLDISLRENSDASMTVYAALGPIPERNTEEFFLRTMTANLLGRETGGSALGLSKDGKKLTLLNFYPGDISYRDFYEALEDFANYAEAWRKESEDFVLQNSE